jgi:iron-sulfur cluster assembly protein
MGRFAVITMTDRAAERVREIVEARANAVGVRLGIKKGGCAGMEYTVDLVTEPNPKDDHVERDGANVYVAPEAALFLFGTEMDFEQTTLRTGFTFRNPNQSSACGCGESVELKPADLKTLAEARALAGAV